eukprot:m.245912 g.245912  ORF g.245912 m.245912 type:complete len:222 (+) comp54470_c0_seq40:1698-2363(+)
MEEVEVEEAELFREVVRGGVHEAARPAILAHPRIRQHSHQQPTTQNSPSAQTHTAPAHATTPAHANARQHMHQHTPTHPEFVGFSSTSVCCAGSRRHSMPPYEALIMLRAAEKELLIDALYGVARRVVEAGGVVRSVQCMKQRSLPYRVKAHNQYHTQSIPTFMQFHSNPAVLKQIDDHLRYNTNVLRYTVIKTPSIHALHPTNFARCRNKNPSVLQPKLV